MCCGLCVEACPYDALFMGSGFERGKYERKGLVIPLEELRSAPKKPSTWFRPQLEGKYDPHKDDVIDWDNVGRESGEGHQEDKAKLLSNKTKEKK